MGQKGQIMGDRANIIITQGGNEPPVVVYSHWGGSWLHGPGLREIQDAARTRIGDSHYYTALAIEVMSRRGFLSGVGTSLDDNEHPVIVLSSITGEATTISEAEAREFLAEWKEDLTSGIDGH